MQEGACSSAPSAAGPLAECCLTGGSHGLGFRVQFVYLSHKVLLLNRCYCYGMTSSFIHVCWLITYNTFVILFCFVVFTKPRNHETVNPKPRSLLSLLRAHGTLVLESEEVRPELVKEVLSQVPPLSGLRVQLNNPLVVLMQ